jgi:hypothetical protein
MAAYAALHTFTLDGGDAKVSNRIKDSFVSRLF